MDETQIRDVVDQYWAARAKVRIASNGVLTGSLAAVSAFVDAADALAQCIGDDR